MADKTETMIADDLRQRIADAIANAECEKQSRCAQCMADAVLAVLDQDAETLRSENEDLRKRADLAEEAIRADERARCVAELRAYSKDRMAAAVAEVVAGKDAGFVSVSHAASVDRAAKLLESRELSEAGVS